MIKAPNVATTVQSRSMMQGIPSLCTYDSPPLTFIIFPFVTCVMMIRLGARKRDTIISPIVKPFGRARVIT